MKAFHTTYTSKLAGNGSAPTYAHFLVKIQDNMDTPPERVTTGPTANIIEMDADGEEFRRLSVALPVILPTGKLPQQRLVICEATHGAAQLMDAPWHQGHHFILLRCTCA